MPLNYDELIAFPHQEIVQQYADRDVMLYALGVGLGADPLDVGELRYVFERDLHVLPTFPVVLAMPSSWLQDPRLGIDLKTVLHGEQRLKVHKPLPVAGTVVAKTRVAAVYDKGAGRGAIIQLERDVRDRETGELYATVGSGIFLRGDGGFGREALDQPPAPPAIPNRDPDHVVERGTLDRTALIYRLSGDRNPLHADPAMAKAAGFPKPILHGLCTFANAAFAVVTTACEGNPVRLEECNTRFSAPMFPGETIRTEIWQSTDAEVLFRAKVVERDVIVLTGGNARIRP